ncbi:MAG: hypothetical protein Q9166_001495 [cf. Caloplaca sp. 2 TL-2023]
MTLNGSHGMGMGGTGGTGGTKSQGRSGEEEYDQRCHAEIARLEKIQIKSKPEDHIQLNDDDEPNRPKEIIGPFRATYYKSGLFSTIYKACIPTCGEPCGDMAYKVTVPSQCTPPHNPLREARILAKAKIIDIRGNNKNIIPLIDTFHLSGGKYALQFKFFPIDLDALLHSSKCPFLTPRRTTRILRSLFSGLAHLHTLNIIHRDIKPSNILLETLDGPVYIADFGIAWTDDDPASEPSDSKITDVGTTAYRPPELLFGHRSYGCELDMWAAGCVVAEIVAGKPHPSLFDSGPLGSDLALIQSIFKTLGTPTDEIWPV